MASKFSFKKLKKAEIGVVEFMRKYRVSHYTLSRMDKGLPVKEETSLRVDKAMKSAGL